MSKDTHNNFHLLIPAAGNAKRMGAEVPKPYLKINGTPILRHTINKFININGLQSIVIIINEAHLSLFNDAVEGLDNVSYVIGSNTRKNSVYNGLKSFSNLKNNEKILIHDAARPLVHKNDILNLLRSLNTNVAATLASPISDTLIKNDETVARDDMWAVQTPQGFDYASLLAAHETHKENDGFTDDCGLMRAEGHHVHIVPARRDNIKITTQEDYEMAQSLMQQKTKTRTAHVRTAMGFDVHAFESTPSDRKLIMGGIKIPHEVALKGHSDADVVLHAATDAILGTINEGDIGTHFPPSDDQWKDADSAIFLEKAIKLLNNKGATLTFLDITIMAEAPKIGPYRAAMQRRIAEITGLTDENISIKATTTEGLGFTGRKEGIAAQALATTEITEDN